MTPDLDTLERLALAVRDGDFTGRVALAAACSPDVVLSLIATTRRLEAALREAALGLAVAADRFDQIFDKDDREWNVDLLGYGSPDRLSSAG